MHQVNFKDFIPNFVCVLTNKRYETVLKHIEHNFHSVVWVMPQGKDLGVLRVKNLSVGLCHFATSTASSSFLAFNSKKNFLKVIAFRNIN